MPKKKQPTKTNGLFSARFLGSTTPIHDKITTPMGISKLKLITNNPKKRVGLIGYGLEIVENISIEIDPNVHNKKYLETKRDRMGHDILK